MGLAVMTPEAIVDIVNSHTKEKEGIRAIARRLGVRHFTVQRVLKKHEQSIEALTELTKDIPDDKEETIIHKIAA